jgi:hypothetical protein
MSAKIIRHMNASSGLTTSKLLSGAGEQLRQNSLTRWMSRDLTQAAGDFCRNLGLFVIYCETSPDHLTRYLLWRLPQGAGIEVRSGRTKEKFEDLDRTNRARNWRLLSLHVNESDVYSAVWITSDHFETAKAFLLAHGITVAQRNDPDPDRSKNDPKEPKGPGPMP